MIKQAIYAVYKGESLLTEGTAAECADFMGWRDKKQTYYFAAPSYLKRAGKCGNSLVVVRIEEDEEE